MQQAVSRNAVENVLTIVPSGADSEAAHRKLHVISGGGGVSQTEIAHETLTFQDIDGARARVVACDRKAAFVDIPSIVGGRAVVEADAQAVREAGCVSCCGS